MYNSTKKRALEILEDQKWMDVPRFARKAGMRPTRRAYTYLRHLADLGLVVRGKDANSKHYYRITPRGLERLKWLRAQIKKPGVEQVIVALLPLKAPSPQT